MCFLYSKLHLYAKYLHTHTHTHTYIYIHNFCIKNICYKKNRNNSPIQFSGIRCNSVGRSIIRPSPQWIPSSSVDHPPTRWFHPQPTFDRERSCRCPKNRYTFMVVLFVKGRFWFWGVFSFKLFLIFVKLCWFGEVFFWLWIVSEMIGWMFGKVIARLKFAFFGEFAWYIYWLWWFVVEFVRLLRYVFCWWTCFGSCLFLWWNVFGLFYFCVRLICLSLKRLFRVLFVGLFFRVLVPLALHRRLFTVMGGQKVHLGVAGR